MAATDTFDTPTLARVRLQGIPIDLLTRAQQHFDELKREFALIAAPTADGEEPVPARVLALAMTLRERYGSFAGPSVRQIEEAIARGDREVDVTFEVPVSVAEDAEGFARLLDEADDYCRGDDLLTLAAPADVVRFRRWYLTQFVDQISGAAPVPWRAVEQASLQT